MKRMMILVSIHVQNIVNLQSVISVPSSGIANISLSNSYDCLSLFYSVRPLKHSDLNVPQNHGSIEKINQQMAALTAYL